RKRPPRLLLRFRKWPPFPRGPTVGPCPRRAATSSLPVASDRNRPRQKLLRRRSSLPLQVSPGPGPLPVPFPPCHLLKRRCRISGRKDPRFPVFARRLAAGRSRLPPGDQGQDSPKLD